MLLLLLLTFSFANAKAVVVRLAGSATSMTSSYNVSIHRCSTAMALIQPLLRPLTDVPVFFSHIDSLFLETRLLDRRQIQLIAAQNFGLKCSLKVATSTASKF